MLKWRGFTIIEVLTTITILGIVATIAAPEYWKIRSRDTFRAEGQNLFDALLDARNAALTNKFCNDGSTSVRWSVFVDTNTVPVFYRIRCYSDDTTFINESESVRMEKSQINVIDFNDSSAPNPMDGTTGNTFPGNMLISFFSGGVTGRIDYVKSGSNKAQSVLLTMQHTESDYQHTICFNRVSGFPTFNKTGTTCQDY